jgi:hypothetical protein
LKEARSPESAVEAAIKRVLDAEQAARESIATSRTEAAQVAERARAVARALAQRTHQRIRRLRAAFESHLEAEVGAIEAQALALAADDEPGAADLERVERAVASLAAQLTGGRA